MKTSKNKGAVIAASIAISLISLAMTNFTYKGFSYSEKQVWTELPTPDGGKTVTYQKDYKVDYHSEKDGKLSVVKTMARVK